MLVQAAQCKSVKGSESQSSITVLTGSEGTEGLEQDEERMSQIWALGAGSNDCEDNPVQINPGCSDCTTHVLVS